MEDVPEMLLSTSTIEHYGSLLFQSGRSEASGVSGHSNPATSLKKNTSNFDRRPLLLEIREILSPATDPTPDHPQNHSSGVGFPVHPSQQACPLQGTVECIRHFCFVQPLPLSSPKCVHLPKLKLGPQ